MFNQIVLVGFVGADPDMRQTANGGSVANIRLATSESWRDKESGERKEATEWHTVVAFGKLADTVGEYVRKGKPLMIVGKVRTRKWQDRDGNDRYTTEVVAQRVQFLPDGKSGGSSQGQRRNQREEEAANEAPEGYASGDDGFDDDIPF